MQHTKVRSFTLSELLVVMIITAIVVGLAFSVLNLVIKQIRTIEKNFQKNTELSLFEQRLWQDFNGHNTIKYSDSKLILLSDTDTVYYTFNEENIFRNRDTIRTKLSIVNTYYLGKKVRSGYIDAISLSAKELPDYSIFISSKSDASHFMNQDGF